MANERCSLCMEKSEVTKVNSVGPGRSVMAFCESCLGRVGGLIQALKGQITEEAKRRHDRKIGGGRI